MWLVFGPLMHSIISTMHLLGSDLRALQPMTSEMRKHAGTTKAFGVAGERSPATSETCLAPITQLDANWPLIRLVSLGRLFAATKTLRNGSKAGVRNLLRKGDHERPWSHSKASANGFHDISVFRIDKHTVLEGRTR